MLQTPRMGLPYPERSDTADVPRDIHALALGVESHSHICMLQRQTDQIVNPPGFAGSIITYPLVLYDPDSMYHASGSRAGWVELPFPGIWLLTTWCIMEDDFDASDIRFIAMGSHDPPYTGSPVGITQDVKKGGSASLVGVVPKGQLSLQTTSIWKANVAGEQVSSVAFREGLDPAIQIKIVAASFTVSCIKKLP